MDQFIQLQTLTLIIYELHIRTIKVYHDLISHYIVQFRSLDNKMIIDDFQYSKEVLTNLMTQLQPIRKKLLEFEESEVDKLKNLLSEISDYVRNDVVDMSLLTLEAAFNTTFEKSKEGPKLDKVQEIHSGLKNVIERYDEGDMPGCSEEIDKLKILLSDLEADIQK